MMEELKGHIVLVEGLKDKRELVGLGANPNMVRTIAGHIDKLNSLGIRHHNLYIRNRLAKLLNLRDWETLGVKVRRFLEENEV